MADFESLEKQIEVLAQATARGFEGVNGRLDKLEAHVEIVDQKLERIERTLDSQIGNHIALETRVTKLEQPVA